MKSSLTKLASLLLVFVVATHLTYSYTHNSTDEVNINMADMDAFPLLWKDMTFNYFHVPPKKIKPAPRPRIRGDLKAFLVHMGKIEGLGSYTTISRSGYLGMYQFHPKTLRAMGINIEADEFLNNPSLQDSVMIAFMKSNARSLRGIIKKYNGTEYEGVYVTKAGILAGAHLVGPGGMLAFFYPEKYEFKTSDGNGVHVSEYMKKFAHYKVEI
jgi:hypothetical protein